MLQLFLMVDRKSLTGPYYGSQVAIEKARDLSQRVEGRVDIAMFTSGEKEPVVLMTYEDWLEPRVGKYLRQDEFEPELRRKTRRHAT